jgi:hypothetical protein
MERHAGLLVFQEQRLGVVDDDGGRQQFFSEPRRVVDRRTIDTAKVEARPVDAPYCGGVTLKQFQEKFDAVFRPELRK